MTLLQLLKINQIMLQPMVNIRHKARGRNVIFLRLVRTSRKSSIRHRPKAAERLVAEGDTKCVSGVQGRSPWEIFGFFAWKFVSFLYQIVWIPEMKKCDGKGLKLSEFLTLLAAQIPNPRGPNLGHEAEFGPRDPLCWPLNTSSRRSRIPFGWLSHTTF